MAYLKNNGIVNCCLLGTSACYSPEYLRLPQSGCFCLDFFTNAAISAINKHLVAKGKEDPENPTLQKEILDVLCHLINLNDQQKLIISQMRERKKTTDVSRKDKQSEVNLFCEEQLVQEPNLSEDEDDGAQEEPVDYSRKGKNHVSPGSVVRADSENGQLVERRLDRKYLECNGTNPPSPASLVSPSKLHDYTNGYHGPVPRGESKDMSVQTRKDRPGDASNGFFTSPEKKTKHLQQEPEDSWSEDIHDLVTQEEFMHALSLLTLKECEEVVVKRMERRKRNAFSTVFSSTIWEKPETKRKRRAWLMSGAGSPPNLRRKNRATTSAALASSQPPSCPSSRPPSRAPSPTPSASSSTPLYQSPHHSNATSLPASPDSSTKSRSQSPVSEEICPMCNVKGADLQCDGCGIVYHSQCVDALDIDNPDQWLCLKCEQLGLRSRSLLDPSQQIQRREALCERERLLRQRAELTVAKAELEQRKRDMSMALQEQRQRKLDLYKKESETRLSIARLKAFLQSFQGSSTPPLKPLTPIPSLPADFVIKQEPEADTPDDHTHS